MRLNISEHCSNVRWRSNLPLQPSLKSQSTTWGTPRRTLSPLKRSSRGRARWWVGTDCWPRRSWKCWRPRRQSHLAPRWSSWWFRETLGSWLEMVRHTNPRWQTAWIHLTAQVVFHKAHFVPCRLEVDGERKPDSPLFMATPRGNSRGRRSLTLRAGKSGRDPFDETLRRFPQVTMLRLSKITAPLTMLGGSLVRIPVSLYHGRFWLVQQHRTKMPTGLCDSPLRPKNIHTFWPRRTEREP